MFLSLLLFKALFNGEYSNLTFPTTPGLYPKSSPVKYSYFKQYSNIHSSNYLDDDEETLPSFLPRLSRILSSSVNVIFKIYKS